MQYEIRTNDRTKYINKIVTFKKRKKKKMITKRYKQNRWNNKLIHS